MGQRAVERHGGEHPGGRVQLPESLLLMARKGTPPADENRAAVRRAKEASRRLIFVSLLAGWSEQAEERLLSTLPLGHVAGFPVLTLPEDVRGRIPRSFAHELGHWRRGHESGGDRSGRPAGDDHQPALYPAGLGV